MDKKKRSYFNVRTITGLLIIAAGILLLLDSLHIITDYHVDDFWPVILIVIGLGKIFQPKGQRQIYWGVIITIVGTLFLLNNLAYINFWFDNLWPFLLILLGIEILRCGFFKHRIHRACDSVYDKKNRHFKCWRGFPNTNDIDTDEINISVVLGGGEYKYSNKHLKGGNVSVILGGCELDFRNADMENEEMVLETSSIMGGIDIRVPSQWHVVMKGQPVMGSIVDKTVKPENPAKKLILKSDAIMGGVEVKN
jgi:predicted membrane protein